MKNYIRTIAYLLFSLSLLCSVSLYAQVYKNVDEQGNVTFSDTPGEKTEEVTVQEPNSIPAVNAHRRTKLAEKKPEIADYSIAITSPANEAIIPLGPGNFSVEVSLEPSLQEGHQLQILLDNRAFTEPQTSSYFELRNAPRASRSLVAVVLNSKGKILERSDPVVVHVFRPKRRN